MVFSHWGSLLRVLVGGDLAQDANTLVANQLIGLTVAATAAVCKVNENDKDIVRCVRVL